MRFASPIIAVLPLLAFSAIASGQQNVDSPRLYHVEIIAFQLTDGDRYEEDLFHGREQLRAPPLPGLLKLPPLELETVALPALGSFDPAPGSVDPTADSESGPVPDPLPGGAVPAEAQIPGDSFVAGDIAAPAATLLQDRLELLDVSAGAAQATLAIATPEGFRVLASDELELGDVRARLNRFPYRVLAHSGWVQAGLDQNLAVPLDLKLLGVSNPRGTIQVYLGSYLHAVVDLEFVDGRGSFWRSSPAPGLSPLEYAGRYELKTEQNRIGLGRLVYLDHPLFGLILRIIRAPEPEEDELSGQPAA